MPKIDTAISEATALEMYRKMTEIRQFEKRAHDLFLQNLVKGTTHLGTGQEAVAAGVSQAMNRRRLHVHHLPRPQPRAGPRHPDDPGDGRTAGPRERPHARQGRLDAPAGRLPRHPRRLRDHRRAACHRQRRGLVGPVPRHQAGHGLLPGRRRDQHRRLPRGAQPGRGLAPAGDLHLREQPVHGVHGDRHGDRGAQAGRRPRRLLRAGPGGGGRQRRGGGLRGGRGRDRPRQRRRRPGPDRGAHLPARRPLPRRPRQVPARRGGQGVAGPGPAARLPPGPHRPRRGRGDP